MNSFRRRRSFGHRSDPLQLCTGSRDMRAAQLESVVTWIGPPGSHQPVASLPPRRWRWLLCMLLHWGGRWRLSRRAHDWLAQRIGMSFIRCAP